MNVQATDYIRSELQNGKNANEIQQALRSNGWAEADIRAAMLAAIQSPSAEPPPPAAQQQTGKSGWSFRGGRLTYGYGNGARTSSPRATKTGSVIFLLVGVVTMIFGGYSYLSAKALAERGVTVSGTVIRLDEKVKTDEDGTSRTYRPVVEYSLTKDGMKQTYSSDFWRSPSPFRVGQTVELIYDPDKPSDIKINTPGEIYVGAYFGLGIGGIFFMVGLGMLIVAMARGRKQAQSPTQSAGPSSQVS